MAKIKTIGILTSGGDAPGMNAAIRAVTRSAIYNGYNVKAIYRGYDGLINDEIKSFTTENVSGIIGTGGTILKTARSKEFMTEEGRQKAYETIQKEEIDALVVIGGNGSLTGAMNCVCLSLATCSVAVAQRHVIASLPAVQVAEPSRPSCRASAM